ncbi:MAG: hypothetical protein IPK55_14970 [Streptococcus sp.]|nr:hypothetical protein [Streptococcus sp.]
MSDPTVSHTSKQGISSVSSSGVKHPQVVKSTVEINEVSGFEIVDEDNSNNDNVDMPDRDESESYTGHEEQEEAEEERTEQ